MYSIGTSITATERQRSFRSRSDVLFASIHQTGVYPGTGLLTDTGSGPGEGYTINLPVYAGSEGEPWLSLLEWVILPAALDFRPQRVLISAGFDAHRDDPLRSVGMLSQVPARVVLEREER